MIENISINNYALIDKKILSWRAEQWLSFLTGHYIVKLKG